MEHEDLFKAGGILLMIAGILSIVYWVAVFVELFEGVILPSYKTLMAMQMMTTIENIFMTVCTIIFSVALILVGTALFLFPGTNMGGGINKAEIEERINRLQNIVWKILQKIKKKE